MTFDLKKLMPWNWFKKEEEAQQGKRELALRTGELPVGLPEPIVQFQQEMNRLFDQTIRSWLQMPTVWGESTSVAALLKPTLDIQETDKAYRISVELPGVSEKEIQITLEDDVLWIQAEKRHEVEEKEGRFHRIERSYGIYQRALNLPPNADQERIEASFKNGVLTVTIGKKEDAGISKGRVIPIQG